MSSLKVDFPQNQLWTCLLNIWYFYEKKNLYVYKQKQNKKNKAKQKKKRKKKKHTLSNKHKYKIKHAKVCYINETKVNC